MKIGDIVAINLDECAKTGGYETVKEMMPYFSTQEADYYTSGGGEFIIKGISMSGTFDSGEAWTNFILKPCLKQLSYNDFLGKDNLIDWETISALGGSKEFGYIFVESYNLTLLKTSEEILEENLEAERDFDNEMNYFGSYSNEHRLSSIWSVFGESIKFDEKNNLPDGCNTLIYSTHWGNRTVSVPILGNTWGDLYKAADKAILQSGDGHHVFIENISPIDGVSCELITGS